MNIAVRAQTPVLTFTTIGGLFMKLNTLALVASIFSLLAAVSGSGSGIYSYLQTDYYTLPILLTNMPYWLMNLTFSAFFFAFYRNLK